MRINLRIKIKGATMFFMLAQTQSLTGITSKIVNDSENKHYIFWDLEQCSLANAKLALSIVQNQYDLGNIFITSDFPKSFRAWCFDSPVDFKTLLKILLDTAFLDYNFFYWTVQKGKATLRISQKHNRPQQKIIAFLNEEHKYLKFKQKPKFVFPLGASSRHKYLEFKQKPKFVFPSKFEQVEYDTGTDKIGIFKKFDFDRGTNPEER